MSHENGNSGQGSRLTTGTQNIESVSNLKLTPDVVKRLTDKLSQLTGEDLTKTFEQISNGHGQLLNEEGLPIIDITEPAYTHKTQDVLIPDELELPLLSTLPPPAIMRLREQRDRILDQLEEEERLERNREEQTLLDERQEILRKRKEAAVNEKERLKVAKEMQKKMGKALLQNLVPVKAQDEVQNKVTSDDIRSDMQNFTPYKKKVSFVDSKDEDSRSSMDWGDIAPARLRSTGRPSLLASSDALPTKMNVVERIPLVPQQSTNEPDSDDESDSGSVRDVDADIDNSSDTDQEPILEDEEFDFDFAQHHREIALQYHEKRNAIGEAALAALTSHSHDDDGSVKDIPLDIPLVGPERPSISRFKATRLATSYSSSTLPPTSMGASIVPASTARTLQRAIRTGKLDADEHLVGGDADSASDDENNDMQELLDMLQKGEMYNLGPNGNYIHAPVPPPAASQLSTALAMKNLSYSDLPPIDRPKTSKFKLSRASAGRPLNPSSSGDDTPVSILGRPSTKLPSSVRSSSGETSLKPSSTMATNVLERSSSNPPSTVTPSIPLVPSTRSSTAQPSAVPAFSIVVESPSFTKQSQTRARPSHPPTVKASVVPVAPQSTSAILDSASPRGGVKAPRLSRFKLERS